MSPAALYGCGRGGDGAHYRSLGDFGTSAALEVGLGYAAAPAPAVRLEVLVEYRPRFAFEGRANFLEPGRRQSVAADLPSLSGMLAAYVNLAAPGLPKLGSLRAVRRVWGRPHEDRRDVHDLSENDDCTHPETKAGTDEPRPGAIHDGLRA